MLNISIDQSLQKEFEKRDRLSGLFPGIHCGNPACVAFCAETLDIAKKLNLDCKKHLSAEIKEKIVSKYGCRGVTERQKVKIFAVSDMRFREQLHFLIHLMLLFRFYS